MECLVQSAYGGGSGKAKRTGPIRAPDPTATGQLPDGSGGSGNKKPFGKGSLVKPVAKGLRLPIVIMSAVAPQVAATTSSHW